MSRALQGDARPGLARCNANIELLQPTGSRTYATFKLGGTEVIAELQAHDVTEINQRVELTINMNRAVIIDPSNERVL
jgi:multiple sugar transport system ATP-binding protein